MASPSIYDRQLNYSHQQQILQMPETLNPLASIPNMSGQKPKLSRLQLMRQNYEKKRQKDAEERLAGLRAEQTERTHSGKAHSGGTVRAFFAERRAMEVTAKGNDSLPPIQSHFRKMKDSSSTPPQQTNIAGETRMLPDYSGRSISSGKKRPVVYHRKKSKGVDKQNPLPSLQKRHSNVQKPPTPNRRYETHHTLVSEENDNEQQQNATIQHVPQPPQKPNPMYNKKTRPTIECRSDFSDDNCSNYSDDPPPNLTKLKALRKRRLSKQMSLVRQETIDKPTDFQKWQLAQDRERVDRLEKHKQKTTKKEEKNQDVSLSMRERELMEKIKAEQEKLQEIKKLQQELEEQEISEDNDTSNYNLMVKNMLHKQDSLGEKKNTDKAKQINVHVHKTTTAREEQVTPEKTYTETNTEPESKRNFTSLYEQAAENEKEVDVDVSPCSICGRNFATDRLARHKKICDKNSKTKRKAFDVQKQRVAGMEHEKYVITGQYKKETPKAIKADWRVQHENFMKTIRYAKGADDEPPPVIENPHYQACPYCKRKFNPETAERHIPRCKDIKARPAPPPKSNRKR